MKISNYILLMLSLISGVGEILPSSSYAATPTESPDLSALIIGEPFLKIINYEGPWQQDIFIVPEKKLLIIEQISISTIAYYQHPLSREYFNAGLSTDSVFINILFGSTSFSPQNQPTPGLPPRTSGYASQLVKLYVLPGQTLRIFAGIGGHPEIRSGSDISLIGRLIDYTN